VEPVKKSASLRDLCATIRENHPEKTRFPYDTQRKRRLVKFWNFVVWNLGFFWDLGFWNLGFAAQPCCVLCVIGLETNRQGMFFLIRANSCNSWLKNSFSVSLCFLLLNSILLPNPSYLFTTETRRARSPARGQKPENRLLRPPCPSVSPW